MTLKLSANISSAINSIEIPNNGEVWEEVDLNNWPTDWVDGDRIKFIPYRIALGNDPSSWTTKPPSVTISNLNNYTDVKEVIIGSKNTFMINIGSAYTLQCFKYTMMTVHTVSNLNNNNFCEVSGCMFNAGGIARNSKQINSTALIKSYIYKMWRLKTTSSGGSGSGGSEEIVSNWDLSNMLIERSYKSTVSP